MGEFSPFHWLVVLSIVVLLFGGKKIPEVMRGLGETLREIRKRPGGGRNGRRGGPHPLPVTGPIETSKWKNPDEMSSSSLNSPN
jgi:TatA/E family protein of Tat protein translocase